MAPSPRCNLAFVAALWIAVALCGVSMAVHGASVASGTSGLPTWDSGPSPWDSVRPPTDVLADAEDNSTGLDGLPFATGLDTPDARRHPIKGHGWLAGHRRFLTPFETGPPLT